jgi:hypothetical protein
MVIKTGVPLVFILVFTWLWPKPGGIITILYGFLQIRLTFFSSPDFTIPLPFIAFFYLLLTTGGILSFLGAGPYKRVKPHDKLLSRTMIAAKITAYIPVLLGITLYLFLRPPAVLGSILGLVTALIAFFGPGPGGVLMLLVTGLNGYLLYDSNWENAVKLPGYIFCALFLLSALIHIFVAWYRRTYQDSIKSDVSRSSTDYLDKRQG